jgi:signal transduction histidine kinase
LTNAAEVLALPAGQAAQGMPVAVSGVVTAAQPDANWKGRFFVQDATAGVFVDNLDLPQPTPGDFVEVSGISHPGGYAPIISRPHWRKLRTAPLPAAKSVPIEQVMAGIEDSQRVEISGIVRAFQAQESVVVFEIVSGGYRLDVHVPPLPGVEPQELVGARVRARGTAATFFSGRLRHLITVTIHVPLPSDFIVEKVASGDPFESPLIPLDSLAQYRGQHELGNRIHVKGTVTYQRPGEDLFLQDATSGMQIKSRQLGLLAPGEIVEAVGFPDFERFLPVLQDAVFRKTSEPSVVVSPKLVSEIELRDGLHHADYITLQGKLLDRATNWRKNPAGTGTYRRTILMLQGSSLAFSAELETSSREPAPLSEIPRGSTVEVSGICVLETARDGKLTSLQILLPRGDNVRILEQPSWWTPERLVIGLAGLFTVLLFAVIWTVVISKKNSALKIMVGEKERAQIALQHANLRLEERVKERSEQLKLQITARQESELQFKAVLNERTRLAQELHDTLEQTLTGIALQMDTAAKFAAVEGERANHHLELARNLVTQSQAEVRCSVWNLRSRSLAQIDLPALLINISKQMTDDTRIQVEVTAQGRVRPLPEIIEENLMRVAQEALTNIIKHSQATRATIALDYGPQNIRLHIQDNGTGFVLENHAGPREGHFGLLGITERTKRLRGDVSLASAPGAGTTLQVTIPIEPPSASGAAASTP